MFEQVGEGGGPAYLDFPSRRPQGMGRLPEIGHLMEIAECAGIC